MRLHNLLSLLCAAFFVTVEAKDPADNLGACAKKCLSTTLLSSSSPNTCGSALTDWPCLCSNTPTTLSSQTTSPETSPEWATSLKSCHDACSIGQREGLYKLLSKDKSCKHLLAYLKLVDPEVLRKRGEERERQKVLGKEEAEKKKVEEAERKGKGKEKDNTTLYSILTAVGVLIFSVVVGNML